MKADSPSAQRARRAPPSESALAETRPGPLIIVVAFVGFMAGYNHFQQSWLIGTIGLLAFVGKGVVPPPGGSWRWGFGLDRASMLASLLLLKRFRLNVVYVILISIAAGALRHQLGFTKT